MGILSNNKGKTPTPSKSGILSKYHETKQAQDTFWSEKLAPKVDTKTIQMFGQNAAPKKPAFDSSVTKSINTLQAKQSGKKPIMAGTVEAAKSKEPAKTPIDQRLHIGGEALKNDSRSYIGMNLIPAYKEDKPLAKVGKGIVNYGIGGALSLVSNIAGAPQQAIMQADRATVNAVKGKQQQTSEMSFGKDILGAKKDNLLTQAAATVLDPTTYIGGGIVDDLSRAGIMGKASKPSTEMVKTIGSRQQGILKQAGKAMNKAKSIDISPANKTAEKGSQDVTGQLNKLDQYFQEKRTEPARNVVENVQPIGGSLPEPSAKVNLNTKKQRKPLNLYTNIVDSQHAIDKLSKKTGGRESLLASNSRNVGGTVDYIMKNGLVDRQGNAIGESLQDVANTIPKGKEQAFWDYMMQRGNIDRAREQKPIIPNYTPEMSKQAAGVAEAANPEFKAIGDNVTGWIDKFMRTWGVDAGTVDAAKYDLLRQTYQSYVPTQREFSELEKAMPGGGIGRKFVDQSSPIKRATGSERNIKNPIENIMGLVNRTVRTARYNEVGQELLKSVQEGKTDLAEIIPANEGMFANTDNIVTVLENGKPTYLRINDKGLLDALEGLPKTINNLAGLRKVTGVYKGLITQKNPLFAVRNVARDIPTAYIYGSTANPFKFGKDLVKAGKDILTNGENFQRYRAIGGGGSNFFKQGDTVAKDLTGGKNIFQKAGGVIETFNNMTETAPRLAEFNRTFERTGDIDKALYAANDVTVNFARGGNWTKSAEPLVPYLNAGVQGLDKLYRNVKDPKKFAKMLVTGGISITAPTIGLYMVNKDNPHYQDLDSRTKDNYFLIPSGNKDENGYSKTFIKIPKSRELGVLFGSLFERALRARDGDKEAWKGFGNTVATNFAPANPIENNFFAPIYNLKSNKDFAGRTIVPQGMLMDNRSPYLQYDEKASEVAKKIGELSTNAVEGGLSPKQIDYLIKSYTGVVGQLGIPATTQGGDPLKTITTQFTADPLYSSQTLTNFYDNYDKLQRAATDKNIVEQLPTSGKENVVTDEEALRNKFKKASEQISGLNKQIKQIGATLAPDKETKVRELRQQIQDIAKAANALIQ